MQRSVYNVEILFAPAKHVPDFGQGGLVDFHWGTRESINAAHFLHRRRRDRKDLRAAAEQYDLLLVPLRSPVRGPKPQQRTPVGYNRLNPRTRFSIEE